MFYTNTITLERLKEIHQQITDKKDSINICEEEYCILFHMKLPKRNTRKKELILLLRSLFTKRQELQQEYLEKTTKSNHQN